MQKPPRRILLATDLSARCDRALDRAGSLAREWSAELVVVHALQERDAFYEVEQQLPSWRHSEDLAGKIEAQIRRELAEVSANVTVIIERGEPTEIIVRNALKHQCDLIIIGLARDEPEGGSGLGPRIDGLLRGSLTPLLIVKQRPRAAYANIVVATDLSEASLHALYAAHSFFPDRKLNIFHAFEVDPRQLPDVETDRAIAAKACVDFVKAAAATGIAGEPWAWQDFKIVVEYGHPSYLIRQYILDKDVDLVVLGTHGRSALLNVLIGSTAKQIISGLSCDVLVVREPRASIESAAGS